MDSETTIVQGMRAAEEKAQYDAACKRLLSEKIILAWIMKHCLEEYRHCDVKEIAEKYIEGQPQVSDTPVLPDEGGPVIQGLDTEDKTVKEGTVTYDIRFYAVAPVSREPIRLIVNVEAQNEYYPGYPLIKRGIYYGSRMISSQYGREFTGARYEKIKKVYSIWICIDPPKSRENTVTRYCIKEEQLVGEAKEAPQNYDLLTVVMLCLGRPEGENYGHVLKLLNVLLSNETGLLEKQRILEEDFDIPMTEKLEREVSEMCNLSKGVEERGIQKGRMEGMKKGHAQGVRENTLRSIKSLMETMGLSAEQAMAALKVPEGERGGYARLLEKQ